MYTVILCKKLIKDFKLLNWKFYFIYNSKVIKHSTGSPIYYVYAMITIEEVYIFILGLKRYKQKKWLKNIVGV